MKVSFGKRGYVRSGNPVSARTVRPGGSFLTDERKTKPAECSLLLTGSPENTSGGPCRSARKIDTYWQCLPRGLGHAGKEVGVVVDFDLVPVNLLLALDAVRRPRHRCHAFRRNLFVAMQTDAVRAIGD